jgi:hypothetical protein
MWDENSGNLVTESKVGLTMDAFFLHRRSTRPMQSSNWMSAVQALMRFRDAAITAMLV